MADVTVPGTGSTKVTIPSGTGDVLDLAQQISYALSTITGGLLQVSSQNVSGNTTVPAPVSGVGTTTQLILSGTGTGSVTVPTGYNTIVVDTSSKSTISGSNASIISNTVGGTFFLTGTATVGATGGA